MVLEDGVLDREPITSNRSSSDNGNLGAFEASSSSSLITSSSSAGTGEALIKGVAAE